MKKLVFTLFKFCLLLTPLCSNGFDFIILKNDTILVSEYENIIEREGDSLNGWIKTQYDSTLRIVEFKNGWISTMKTFHKNDSLVLTEYYNYSLGKFHGLYQKWYDNGIKRTIGLYKNGLQDSTWTYYYANGNIYAKGNYNPQYVLKDFEERVYSQDKEENLIIGSYFGPHSAPDGVWEYYFRGIQAPRYIRFDKGTLLTFEIFR